MIFASCAGPEETRAAPQAVRGLLDLRQWSFRKNGPVSLEGEWEFYPARFVPPADFQGDTPPSPAGYLKLPGVWNDFSAPGSTEAMGSTGFGTYRLRVLPGESAQLLGLKMLEVKTAFVAYAGERRIAMAGKIGRTAAETTPQYWPDVGIFPRPQTESFDLILHVSNFHHRYGGPYRVSELGNADQMRARRRSATQIEMFLLGTLLVMGVYHIGLFSLRRKDRSLLYFGLFALFISIRVFAEGEHFLVQMVPDFNWELLTKIQYIDTYVVVSLFVLFLREIFPRVFPRNIVRVTLIISAIFTAHILILPALIYTRTGPIYFIYILLIGLYITGALFVAAYRRRQGAVIFMLGWVVMLGTTINDLLHDQLMIQTAYVIPFGIFFFFFSQAALLAVRSARAFRTAEELSGRLQTLDRLKDDFLANTSHELRTPLNGIIGITRSVIEGDHGELPAGVRRSLDLVIVSGNRLSSLINDILDSVKLKHRSIELQRTALDLHSETEEIILLSEPLAYGKDLELNNQVPQDLPAIYADRNRLKQILHNLIGNAMKFTDSGSVSIQARVARDEVLISVSDTGIGIAPEKLQDIFHSFEQADTSISRRFGGAGLGLSISRQLVEMHGGRIYAESAGQGSTFYFTMPTTERRAESVSSGDPLVRLRPKESAAPARKKKNPSPVTITPHTIKTEDESGRDRPPRILVVDDDPINLQLITHILRKQNYDIMEAADGYEALRIVTGEIRPDIVLLDVMMPGLSGYDVLKLIRKNFTVERLPVILLTARDQVSDLVTGFQAGTNDYVTKPIIKEELLVRVKFHLHLAEAYNKLNSKYRAAQKQLNELE